MKILITNDDGIASEALKPLAEWAKTLGEVTVVAPKHQQSGKSHAINLHDPIEASKIDFLDGVEAFYVDSTPADCVRFALLALDKKFDLVISGINKGYNMGEDILYSGTDGAAFEAALRGVKAVALSTGIETFEHAFKNLDEVKNYFVRNDLFSVCSLYNVNFPESEPKGILVTRQGGTYYTDEFVVVEDGKYIQKGYNAHVSKGDLTVDTDALTEGYVTITPLTVDRTDKAALQTLLPSFQN